MDTAAPPSQEVALPAQAPRPGGRDLFVAFLGVGLSGFGGVLPFARRALVERRSWLTETDFNETLSLCQSLPGPNVVNLSIVVGSRFAGVKGALACASGLIVAPVGLVLIIAELWDRFGRVGRVPAAIEGLGAAAAGLVAATALKMAAPALREAPLAAGTVIAAAFAGVGLAHLPLPGVLAFLAPLSIGLAALRSRRGRP